MALVMEAECPKCHRKQGEKHVATKKRPSPEKLEHWLFDGEIVRL